MDTQFLIAIVLTVIPLIELRLGLPVVVDYCLKNGFPIWPYFLIVVVLNCLIVLFVYFFMDFLHKHFMKIKIYEKFMNKYLGKIEKKTKKFEEKKGILLYLSLCLFIAFPLPGTGAWTGSVLSWVLKLDRKKSFLSISLGVLLSGLFFLLLSLGLFKLF